MVKLIMNNKNSLFGLTLSLLICSSPCKSQDLQVIEALKTRLEHYNAEYHSERAYLLTDRYLYRPGETIWFQGFVSSKPGGRSTSYSQDFFIKLVNDNGEEMAFRRYPIVDNMISGNFSIPRKLIPGKYFIVAYTGWMKNQSTVEAFRKEILISKYFDKRLKVDVGYDKPLYLAKDTIHIHIAITDHEGKPMTHAEFDYSIETFNKVWLKGASRTNEQGNAIITNILPATDELLLLTVQMKRKKSMGSYAVYIPKATTEPVISFYPEGGTLISHVTNNVAFKVTNQYGLPMPIEGEVLDGAGKRINLVKSSEKGLGIFQYNPPDDSGFLRITYPMGIDKLYPLPSATVDGIVLQLENKTVDSIKFSLHASQQKNHEQSCIVVATMDKRIVWNTIVRFAGSCDFSIPTGSMNPGMLQVSAHDMQGDVLADRLVNITGSREDFHIRANQSNFGSRQRVMLSIEYGGPSEYIDLALSVSLDQMARHKQMLSFEQILNSRLYDSVSLIIFDNNNLSDLETMASPYRVVDWDKVLDPAENVSPYYNQDGISGQVFDKKDNISQLAKVRVTSIPSYRSYETQTNENGQFRVVFGADIIDFNYLNVEAYDASGRTNLTSVIDYDYSQKLKDYFDGRKELQNKEKINDIISYGDPDLIYALRYGSGRFRKTESIMRKKYDPYQYRDYNNVLDIIKDIRDYDLMDDKIVFKNTESTLKNNNAQSSALIVINGVLWGDKTDILASITPSDITNLVISSSSGDIHRYTPIDFAAVIEITTIQGMYRYRKRPIQFLRDLMNPEHEFYTPDYSFESLSSPDNRKTLYWNTHIQVKSGEPAIITFYTSDIKGVYLSRAEGMDAEGNPVSADFTFSVTE